MKRTLVAITLNELGKCVAVSEVKNYDIDTINDFKNKAETSRQEQAQEKRLLVERIEKLEETIRIIEQEIKVLKGEEE